MHQGVLRFGWVVIFGFLTMGLTSLHAKNPKVYRGDASHLPTIDPSKNFEIKTFGGADKEIETHELELKTARLPFYSGNLKSFPTQKWSSSKSDLYSQAINLRDFEIKKSSDEWSRQSSADRKEPAVSDESESILATRAAATEKPDVKAPNISPPADIKDEELRLLINLGMEFGKVRLGRGFGAVDLKPGVSLPAKSIQGTDSSSVKAHPAISLDFP